MITDAARAGVTAPATAASASVAERPRRILIVDDERMNRTLLAVMLSPDGFLIDMVESGDAALASVARLPPDLILLDVMMPGMNGYQVAAALKSDSATKHIPIIMVTSLHDRESMALKAGARAYVQKPWNDDELLPLIGDLVGRPLPAPS